MISAKNILLEIPAGEGLGCISARSLLEARPVPFSGIIPSQYNLGRRLQAQPGHVNPSSVEVVDR